MSTPSPDVSKELLDVLVCPLDHAHLKYTSSSTLTCPKCARVFPIVKGVPNLLIKGE